ncbi:MAG: hypothetical protein M0Z50_15545 [Planctomycetia bacterium]|nr:hypothetical protein [Planctomycetia bacterium]
MDGSLTIIDGEPGKGKTLTAIRLMIESAKRGRNIVTNVALKPEFIRRLKAGNYGIQVIKPTVEEIEHFWEYTPAGCDIYIDEAHLIWDSDMWKTNRITGFKSYISQFRKEGDSVWLMAQNYENLDKFIRQRATKLISCRRWSWPKILPVIGEKPILFIVTYWNTREGERYQRVSFPRIYTPGMCQDIYTLYDTRGKVETTRWTHKRKTWDELMPTVLTETGEQPAQTGNMPIININQHPPKKYHPILWATMILMIIAICTYSFSQFHSSKKIDKKTLMKIAKLVKKNKYKIRYYGVIGHHVVLAQDNNAGNWPIGEKVAQWKITGYNSDGIDLLGPAGMHVQPWWHPKVKIKTSNTDRKTKAKGIHLGL